MKAGQTAPSGKTKQRNASEKDRSAALLRELKPLDENAASPQEVWSDFFAKRTPSDITLRETVLRLHQEKAYEHVIALIEEALINAKSRPWMYEVLAITYELAGRPKEQIERALLSAVDPSVDFESMMLSSAYLSRFDNHRPALRMYRQASKSNRVRPEPYIMALPLARKLKDHEAVEWAAIGIFNYAWSGDYEKYHRDAKIAAAESIKELKAAGKYRQADAFEEALEQAQAKDLVVELTWSGAGDVDLLVEEPAGTTCSYLASHTSGGGVHLQDGYGPERENCFERYVCVKGMSGKYTLRIRHVWGKIVAGKVRLKVIRHQGTAQETTTTDTISLAQDDQLYVIRLEEGRRDQLVPELEGNQNSGVSLWNPTRRSIPRNAHVMNAAQRRVLSEFVQDRGGSNAGIGGGGNGGNGNTGNQGIVSGAAIGFAPIIRPISTGDQLGVSAVVSPDRRYVRIGINASFSNLIGVEQFSVPGGIVPGSTPNGN